MPDGTSCAAIRGKKITPSELRALTERQAQLRRQALSGTTRLHTTGPHSVNVRSRVRPNQGTVPAGGYGPADLQAMFGVLPTVQSDATVGIVDVGQDPTVASDLSHYRSHFALPPCTEASGCFTELAQNNGNVPTATSEWIGEITLDVESVSAMCPTCHITLVDAYNATAASMDSAVQALASTGVHFISMSFSFNESLASSSANSYFNQPGTIYVAASGDNGYNDGSGKCGGAPVCYPASAPGVVAAGGLSVTEDPQYYYISPWENAGSGCSAYTAEPQAQHAAIGSPCGNYRAVADVSALADPNTGAATYSTLNGWGIFGGTSLATPLIASMYAISGNTSNPYVLYQNAATDPALILDSNTGASTTGCDGSILCTAGPGWDGPTGIGMALTPELFDTTLPAKLTLTPVGGNSESVPLGEALSGAPFTVSGGSGQVWWTATGLPPGVTLDPSTGAWTGTPTRPGSYSVDVAVTDAENWASTTDATFTLTVESPPFTVATASGTPAQVFALKGNWVQSAIAVASGSTSTLNWSAVGLPPGLTLDPTSGVLTGAPTQAGDWQVTLSVSDASGYTATLPIDFEVIGLYACPLRINAHVGRWTRVDCRAVWSRHPNSGGRWLPFPGKVRYAAARLPSGLRENSNSGWIAGTPTKAQAGRFTETIHLQPNGILLTSPTQIQFSEPYTVRG